MSRPVSQLSDSKKYEKKHLISKLYSNHNNMDIQMSKQRCCIHKRHG